MKRVSITLQNAFRNAFRRALTGEVLHKDPSFLPTLTRDVAGRKGSK